MNRRSRGGLVLLLAVQFAAAQPIFRAGAGRRDITPREGVPMWGYGSRHDDLSTGILDPLYADAVVLEAGGRKLALVGLDLGRAPAEASLQRIRARIRSAGIEYSIIAGSHTHHGPVLELTDSWGKGKFRFAAALRYYAWMEEAVTGAILDANGRLEQARIAAGRVELSGFNRNRHTRKEPKISDRELSVLRIDSVAGRPIAVVANFAAHPTSIDAGILKFSADYPGGLKDLVRKQTGAAAIFLQGACGDQATNRKGRDYRAFGEALGREVVRLSASLKPVAPEPRSLDIRVERMNFPSRTNFRNPLVKTMFSLAFFPELVENFLDEYADGVRPRLTVALLEGQIGVVGVSGEFFSAHAIRLKQRAGLQCLIFAGYANGYHQYFPTREAVAEGGYGADSRMSPAAVGAGEQIMDRALQWLSQMRGPDR